MELGIHLPQYGRAASPNGIARVSRHAEALGLAHLWVSDHVVHPAQQRYPSAYLYDPLLTLTWSAAITSRIGLGTSVLVVPQYNPLWLANALSSLDSLSQGRLTLAVGVGWSEAEFDALGQSFSDRGRRTDEILALLRAAWEEDPCNFDGTYYSMSDLRILPKPGHRIPFWIGGNSEAAFRRAVEHGDGVHLDNPAADEIARLTKRLRDARPEPSFTISVRVSWKDLGATPDEVRAGCERLGDAGVDVTMVDPQVGSLDEWIRCADVIAAGVDQGSV
jgi:probable F420-dependent oxidoreductase